MGRNRTAGILGDAVGLGRCAHRLNSVLPSWLRFLRDEFRTGFS